MKTKWLIALQYLLPQWLFTRSLAWLADLSAPRWRRIKNILIKGFVRHYQINLSEAESETPEGYISFNHFFVRRLKPNARPLAPALIISPVDGSISQIGHIENEQLIQAKGIYYKTEKLVTDADLSIKFKEGHFATLYLAPYDYHRVHMPIEGKLIQTIYVPGKLFSVNHLTAQNVINLFANNERLICEFNTDLGSMLVIFIGALGVGGIHTKWAGHEKRTHSKRTISYADQPILFKQGEEIGYFKFGSTIILMFQKNKIAWKTLSLQQTIRMGEALANPFCTGS